MASPIKRSDIITGLNRKGFDSKDGDHIFFVYHFLDGKISRARTKISRGTKHEEIGDSLIGPMSAQCGLSQKQFRDLVNCPLSREQYEQILLEKQLF